MNSQPRHLYAPLEEAIVKTVAFFDLFNYPLTAVEVHRWLWQPEASYQLSEVLEALGSEALATTISCHHGFYFLIDRLSIVRTRLSRYNIAENKFKIAKRTGRCLRFVPFVLMVAVCNTVGFSNGSAKSDIDVVLIVRRGRIWLTRFLVTGVVALGGVRRHHQHIVDRICLSFYLTDDTLDLADIALSPLDPYLAYWFNTLSPLHGQGMYQHFLATNVWQRALLPNAYAVELNDRRLVSVSRGVEMMVRFIQNFLSTKVGDWAEQAVKYIQLKKMARNTDSVAAQPNSHVIISDQMLKFHEKDRRQQYLDQWRSRLLTLGINA